MGGGKELQLYYGGGGMLGCRAARGWGRGVDHYGRVMGKAERCMRRHEDARRLRGVCWWNIYYIDPSR